MILSKAQFSSIYFIDHNCVHGSRNIFVVQLVKIRVKSTIHSILINMFYKDFM